MAAARNDLVSNTWKRGLVGHGYRSLITTRMASSSTASTDTVILTEDDIPGASLAGRNPSSLKNEELKFWLRCRGDSLKGLNFAIQALSTSFFFSKSLNLSEFFLHLTFSIPYVKSLYKLTLFHSRSYKMELTTSVKPVNNLCICRCIPCVCCCYYKFLRFSVNWIFYMGVKLRVFKFREYFYSSEVKYK